MSRITQFFSQKKQWLKAQKIQKLSSHRLFIFFFACILAGALIPSRVTVTSTASLNYRIFFLSKIGKGEPIVKGDFVMFTLRSPLIENGKPQTVIKKVGCTEGEHLSVSNKEYTCDGEILGRAKDFSLKREPLTNFVYNGVIPKDNLFLYGQHKNSFDSKYLGFFNSNQIEAIAYPIF